MDRRVLMTLMVAAIALAGCAATPGPEASPPVDNPGWDIGEPQSSGESTPATPSFGFGSVVANSEQWQQCEAMGGEVGYASGKGTTCLEPHESTPSPKTPQYSPQERHAYKQAYGPGAIDPRRLRRLHIICGDVSSYSYQRNFGELVDNYAMRPMRRKDAVIAKAALMLCPDHPKADKIRLGIKSVGSEPTMFFSLDGRIGKDVALGTYVTRAASHCYWEILDSSGEIMDNNFIQGNARVEVTVSYGFTFQTDGCGTWRKIG